MLCYAPRTVLLAAAGLAAWVLWHAAIGHALADLASVVRVVVIIAAGAILAGASARVTSTMQRRQARAGECTRCPFGCQLPVTPPPRRPAQRRAAQRAGGRPGVTGSSLPAEHAHSVT
ncbi:MAG: hypothetical protein ACLQDY_13785 [Streptosporangiaceae bacterium]